MSSKLLITCREATTYISQNEEHKLSFWGRIKLIIHLLICQFCRLFNKQNQFIINSLINYSVDDALTEEEIKNIERVVDDSSK